MLLLSLANRTLHSSLLISSAIWSGARCPLPLGREDGGWMAVMGRPHRRAVRGYEDRRDRLQVLVEPELGV